MKRTGYCLIAVAFALGFAACEGSKEADLPEHYQHRIHAQGSHGHDADSHGKAGDHGKADEHAKPGSHGAPTEHGKPAPAVEKH